MNDTYNRRFRVIRVSDGDTFRALIDLGWGSYANHAVRLLGVNAPELFSGEERDAGAASRDFVEAWFYEHEEHALAGSEWPFVMHSEKDRESFNRYVATVVCFAGHDLASDLLAAGKAVRA